jgi:hypothetical protein
MLHAHITQLRRYCGAIAPALASNSDRFVEWLELAVARLEGERALDNEVEA